jgi:hypothetical protein
MGALAHLYIARAHAMTGDPAKAEAEYQDFLTLWKDADPDIPILKQAKSEYAKLQQHPTVGATEDEESRPMGRLSGNSGRFLGLGNARSFCCCVAISGYPFPPRLPALTFVLVFTASLLSWIFATAYVLQ